jgi:hypothetical protein
MDKIGKVMREFKEGKLKSSSGQKVTNPKQAIAIGISEQKAMKGTKRYEAGGDVTDSSGKKIRDSSGRPLQTDPLAGINSRRKTGPYAGGGKAGGLMPKALKGGTKMGAVKTAAPSINGVAKKGKTKGTMIKMRNGGSC